MRSRGFFSQFFEACTNVRSLAQLHSLLLKNSLLPDSFFATKLTSSYAQYASIELARKLFDETPHRSVFLWNAILRAYCKEKQWKNTLHLFHSMISTGDKPDNFTVSIALKACAGLGLSAFEMGKSIHGFAKKNYKIDTDMFVGAALIAMYSKCGEMGDAHQVFVEFPQPDVVLWTSMVSGFQQNGKSEEALLFFSQMSMMEHVIPDPVTLVSMVSASTQSGNLRAGRCCHGFIIRMGFDCDLCLVNCLLNFYAKVGIVKNARNLFEKMSNRDVISWSSMVACYAQNGKVIEALELFNEMMEKQFKPNSVTVVSALQACGAACDLREGRRLHEFAAQNGFELELAVSTALVDMYMKCSSPEDAINLFHRMPNKDVVSWAALISGYAQNGLANESLGEFQRMLLDGIRPDAVTLVKILTACSQLGIFQQALCLHGYLVSSGFDDNVFVGASLLDLYSKCGSLDNAIRVFERMGDKDVVVWSSMIAGYGIHGLGDEAIRIFNLMTQSFREPNHVTFVSILSACSHAGLIEEGKKIFDSMTSVYNVVPGSEHYSIMVDILGRKGELDRAMELINQMPIPVGPHVWGALLGGCRIHHNVEMGEIAARNLFKIDPNHTGYYVLMSNIYAVDGKWDNVAGVRSLMREKGLKRIPGRSLIEVGNEVNSFLSGDLSHPKSERICGLLRKLEVRMREEGYVPETMLLLGNVE
ncbi:tetratricopeptide repeat (TPR)-like superfamily protein [Tasmannia lanceolata]|uniref:tetratricopeptide repeat (TPR)-like superfamily protein n=1 Tax=Tasmannia lanceolata TaxID=3420 RepID=UPI0040640461